MARSRASHISLEDWHALAQSADVRCRIAYDGGLDDFQAIVRVVARRDALDWDEAVSILHMVYGWMPTMLRPIAAHSQAERARLLTTLEAAKRGDLLDAAQVKCVQRFANRSVVGSSKLLHVLNPANYAIWDSRVAEVFLRGSVTRGFYSTPEWYCEYVDILREWLGEPGVAHQCAKIRNLSPALFESGDLRLVELVLFRGSR